MHVAHISLTFECTVHEHAVDLKIAHGYSEKKKK